MIVSESETTAALRTSCCKALALQQPQQSQALAAGGQGAGEGEKDGPQCYGEVLRAYADTNALLRKDRRVAMDVEAQLRGIERRGGMAGMDESAHAYGRCRRSSRLAMQRTPNR
eukprot:tig00021127_g18736.t2